MAAGKSNQYKGITFGAYWADGKRTFEQFEKEFGKTHVFKRLPSKERASELKKAFKVATTKLPESDK